MMLTITLTSHWPRLFAHLAWTRESPPALSAVVAFRVGVAGANPRPRRLSPISSVKSFKLVGRGGNDLSFAFPGDPSWWLSMSSWVSTIVTL